MFLTYCQGSHRCREKGVYLESPRIKGNVQYLLKFANDHEEGYVVSIVDKVMIEMFEVRHLIDPLEGSLVVDLEKDDEDFVEC